MASLFSDTLLGAQGDVAASLLGQTSSENVVSLWQPASSSQILASISRPASSAEDFLTGCLEHDSSDSGIRSLLGDGVAVERAKLPLSLNLSMSGSVRRPLLQGVTFRSPAHMQTLAVKRWTDMRSHKQSAMYDSLADTWDGEVVRVGDFAQRNAIVEDATGQHMNQYSLSGLLRLGFSGVGNHRSFSDSVDGTSRGLESMLSVAGMCRKALGVGEECVLKVIRGPGAGGGIREPHRGAGTTGLSRTQSTRVQVKARSH